MREPIMDKDKVVFGYMRAALWATNDSDGTPLDINFDIGDIAPTTRTQIEADCETFINCAGGMLSEDMFVNKQFSCSWEEMVGHDFFLTRLRHGAGFWDGDIKEPNATALTELAHSYSESDLYVGDDGKLYY